MSYSVRKSVRGWLIDRQGVDAIGLAAIGFAILTLSLAMLIGRSARAKYIPGSHGSPPAADLPLQTGEKGHA